MLPDVYSWSASEATMKVDTAPMLKWKPDYDYENEKPVGNARVVGRSKKTRN